jgi:AraC family transcriptional activator of pobA
MIKDSIPLHKLSDRSVAGMQIGRFDENAKDYESSGPMGAHRDDHYIFLLQERGVSRFMLDFKELSLSGAGVLCVLPGQVHHAILPYRVKGWFLALDTMLVGEEYRKVFEQYQLANEPVVLSAELTAKLSGCMALLYDRYQEIDELMNRQIAVSLASSYVGMVAAEYLARAKVRGLRNSRPQQISGQFRVLLLEHFKSIKSPAAYAEMMNISATYLNEAVKSTTGFTVTYLIQYEMVLEAKRLLYYTDLSVKEIAHELGFGDHTYFSRLFTRTAGCSAGKFRGVYRK